jgi:hypothetical protein
MRQEEGPPGANRGANETTWRRGSTTSLPAQHELHQEAVALLADRLGAQVIAEYPSNACVVALPPTLTNTGAEKLSFPPRLPIVLDGSAHLQTVDTRAATILARRLAKREVYTVSLPPTFQVALAAAFTKEETP